ncbi:nuclease SbcCD, D subunit [Chloroherpeton thalassium ATCC 35110]|uniref:Nuclease SbcCD subunit D n=1 Tax=Chloroherpeton thalassium (strain ATCC 35110 / GB-78) TaxID=517418 RepID=B3QT16_CHLT3|nr:exonuclease SbcCD subunit D [Chloroherpeton thalassium]ACF12659.1 nuclease SbcCD, D subunit [Chloroherpeton thalassium ATCC 35110]
MKILHTADIHIGYTTHGKLDQQAGLNTRLLDFQKSFDFLVQTALDEKIDALLFCGDAYRDATPSPTEQQIFARCLKPILEANIPVVMVVGNHDHPFAHGRANALQIFQELAAQVVVIDKLEVQLVETKSGLLRIVGLPWPVRTNLFAKEAYAAFSPEELKSKIHEFYLEFILEQADALREQPDEIPSILAGHLHIDTAMMSKSERITLLAKDPMFSVGALAHKEFDYIALGHIHKFQDLNPGNQPPVVYSGSIERISFNECDEEKGFVMVTIDDAKRVSYARVLTPARPFVSFDIDVTLKSPEPMAFILAEIAKKNIADAIVRVRILCSIDQKSEIDISTIKEALQEAFLVSEVSVEVNEKPKRLRNPDLSKTMTAAEALEIYVEQNAQFKPIKEKVLKIAAELESGLFG